MTAREKNISITLYREGETHHIQTYTNEYRNLMMLIFDKLCPDDFGECLGMGKCGTCLVEIIDSPHALTHYERNEDTTLSKIGITDKNTRLSCQIMVDDQLNGLKLKIL